MNFCLEHDLPDDVIVPLIKHLKENLKRSPGKVASLLQRERSASHVLSPSCSLR